jgi:protein-tyrosine phosphatase
MRNSAIRHLFAQQGLLTVIETRRSRHVDFEGVHNCRDLGGVETTNGMTRFGVLYRSDRLAGLTQNDHQAFRDLGIETVIDMRVADERHKAPNGFPKNTEVNEITYEFWHQHTVKMIADINEGKLNHASTYAAMVNQYTALATDHRSDYREIIDSLLAFSGAPLLFHCTSGKDRTGMVAAIVLLAVGVPREAVVEDYILTNGRVAKVDIFNQHVDPGVIDIVMSAKPDYIHAAIDGMTDSYGSISNYLTDGLGLDAAKRDRLNAMLIA